MVAKRKTVSKLASAVKTAAISKHAVEEDNDMEGQIVPVETGKEQSEQDVVAARTKELKAMPAADLKDLLLSNGLTAGTKEVMIKSLLKHEAKARAAVKELKAKIRAVVMEKKQELESLSVSELGKRCESSGFKGLRSKIERVQRLLIHWQENDGVDQALSQKAQESRKQELDAFDNTKLEKLCTKMGVDPYVKEIMVERISKNEHVAGRYARPLLAQKEDQAPPESKTGDMIESLLANEAQRKKERELQNEQEEALARKRKELKAMSAEDLKKRLTKRKLEASGKKEEMVEALFIAVVQEDAANARKDELKAKNTHELKELVLQQGLESGSKEQMVQTLLAYEAKRHEELKAFEAKVTEVAAQRKQELESNTNAALKDMCVAKGLALGGGKEERIERLVEEAQKGGDFDKVVSKIIRNKRKDELMSMEKPAVVKLCEATGVDPMVKDIMVERIMVHENENAEAMAMTDVEPAAKRARVSKK